MPSMKHCRPPKNSNTLIKEIHPGTTVPMIRASMRTNIIPAMPNATTAMPTTDASLNGITEKPVIITSQRRVNFLIL